MKTKFKELKKRKVRATVLSLSLAFVFAGCNAPSDTSQKINAQSSSKKVNSVISGKVEFPEKFKVKATQDDIISETTVSLIYPSNHPTKANKVIASGVTNQTGGFLLNLPADFSAYNGEPFILEGIKRLNGTGSNALSLRTNLIWNGSSFASITTPDIHINTKTTALALMSGFYTVLHEDTIGKMAVTAGVTQVADVNTIITADVINSVKTLVEEALTENKDPVASVTFKNGRFSLGNKSTGERVAGCIGNPDLCPAPAQLASPLPTITPIPYNNQPSNSVNGNVGGCLADNTCTTPTPVPSPTVLPTPTPTAPPVYVGEFKVNTNTTDIQTNSAIAYNNNGEFVVTWQSNLQDGSGYGIYAQRYDASGNPLGNEFKVNTTTAGSQLLPAIAMSNSGDFVITWQSSDRSSYGIYAQRFNASGVAQGNEFKVNTFTTNAQINPSVSMNATGEFVVAWQSNLQDGDNYGIYAQKFDASGQPQGAEVKANTYTTDAQINPSVAISDSGDFAVTWQSNLQDANGYEIYAQRFNASSQPQGNELRVNTILTNTQITPVIAMTGSGESVITWVSASQDGSGYGVYAQRYDASGVAQGTEFRVNTAAASTQSVPAIEINNNGNFVIAWQSYLQDGSSYGIYAQRFNTSGQPQGNEFRVNTYTNDAQTLPAVAVDPNSNFVITWSSNLQDGALTGIYAQRYNASGTAQ